MDITIIEIVQEISQEFVIEFNLNFILSILKVNTL